jgi:hypothetical protein
MTRIIIAALVALVVSGPAWGQNTPPTLRYICTFDIVASPDGLEPADDFALEFVLETASGKAMLIGNAGMSDVCPSSYKLEHRAA